LPAFTPWQKKTHPVRDGQTNRSSGNESEVHRSYQDRAFHASEAPLFTKFPDHLWGKFRTPTEGFVLLRIIRQCGFDGKGICFESQQSMGIACGLSIRALGQVIAKLEEDGFIMVNRSHKKTNQITLTEKTLINMNKSN